MMMLRSAAPVAAAAAPTKHVKFCIHQSLHLDSKILQQRMGSQLALNVNCSPPHFDLLCSHCSYVLLVNTVA